MKKTKIVLLLLAFFLCCLSYSWAHDTTNPDTHYQEINQNNIQQTDADNVIMQPLTEHEYSDLEKYQPVASPESKQEDPHGGLYVQLGGGDEPDTIGGEIGYIYMEEKHFAFKGGISFLSSESFEDYFVGLNLSVRTKLKYKVYPFVGLGVFAGYSEKEVSADNDGKDNDDDGVVDESGEKDKEINDVMASVFPEFGLHFQLSDSSGITLSARYNYTSEGREHDFWMCSLEIHFYMK